MNDDGNGFEVGDTVFVRGYDTLQGKIVAIETSGPFPEYFVEFNNNSRATVVSERDISVENEFGSSSDVDGNALATLAAREGLDNHKETTSHAAAEDGNFVFATGTCIECGKSHGTSLTPPAGTLYEGCIWGLWKVKRVDEETEEYTFINQQGNTL